MVDFSRAREHFSQSKIALLIDDISTSHQYLSLVAQAESISTETVARLLNLSRGLPFVALSQERADALQLIPMEAPLLNNTSQLIWFNSVEARSGISTGISASDRATTISNLAAIMPDPKRLVSPGHVFPVLSKTGGILLKAGLAEAALDLVKIISQPGNLSNSIVSDPVALFSMVYDTNGERLKAEAISSIPSLRDLPHFDLSQLITYRLQHEQLVARVAEAKLPTKQAGELSAIIYKTQHHQGEHLALVKGSISSEKAILTRVQVESTFSDVFGGSVTHDNMHHSKEQIEIALREIGKHSQGILLYLRRPNTGQLKDQILKVKQAATSSNPVNQITSMREYGIGAQILRDLGAKKLSLLVEKIRNYDALATYGLEVVSQIEIRR
jgi:3,4-dihydroxy 2-butanone 4-phosphate synthase/GTP cyclohydrolase II